LRKVLAGALPARARSSSEALAAWARLRRVLCGDAKEETRT
jgi:hypothetical protein